MKLVQFFKDSVAELKKVIWPTKEDVWSSTKIVVVSLFLFAGFYGFVDWVLLNAVQTLFQLG